jgi:uncharacterized membrane protein YphA (DoxX/SURF4 family)
VIDWVLGPPDTAPRSTILIRCMVGGVFLSEGILKFVYTNQGVGRFTKLGFPAPALTADFVAVLEIVGGALLIAGFLTRFIAIPFVIEMKDERGALLAAHEGFLFVAAFADVFDEVCVGGQIARGESAGAVDGG